MTARTSISRGINSLDAPLVTQMLMAGTTACVAETLSYPLETVKVRQQIQGELVLRQYSPKFNACMMMHLQSTKLPMPSLVGHRCGMIKMIANITKLEGPQTFYNGVFYSLHRQMLYTPFCMLTYDTTKITYEHIFNRSADEQNYWKAQVFAAMTTGAAGIVIGHPTDLIMVRLQAHRQLKLVPSEPLFHSTIDAYQKIYDEGGIRGSLKGVRPNIARTMLVNVSEIICYEEAKDVFLHHMNFNDNMICHLLTAIVTGFATALITSPIDCVKTRYMNTTTELYDHSMDCARKMLKHEGVSAFFSGFPASFLRLALFNVCLWLTYEQLKRVMIAPEVLKK